MKPDFSCQPTVSIAQKVMLWRRVVLYLVYIFVVSVWGNLCGTVPNIAKFG